MKVLVVLGNMLCDDGSMSDILLSRLETAVKLDKEYNFDKIVLTGGAANKKTDKTEAEVMESFLLSSGINANKLILEDKSLTTVQNAKFSAPILKSLNLNEFYLLSSAYHIERKWLNPVKLFHRATGLKVNPLKAD